MVFDFCDFLWYYFKSIFQSIINILTDSVLKNVILYRTDCTDTMEEIYRSVQPKCSSQIKDLQIIDPVLNIRIRMHFFSFSLNIRINEFECIFSVFLSLLIYGLTDTNAFFSLLIYGLTDTNAFISLLIYELTNTNAFFLFFFFS